MTRPQRKNALCSCGSKKKFKRCCGKKGATPKPQADPTHGSSAKPGVPRVVWLVGLLIVVSLVGYFFKDALLNSLGQGSPAFSDKEARESHALMVDVLSDIGKSSGRVHPYLGNAELTQIRQFEQNAGDGASSAQRCDLHFVAGLQEGRLGNLRESINEIKRAYDLLPEAGFDEAKTNYIKFKLGVAYFRLGETENCCVSGGPESCIVPIGPAGVHYKTEGSENAIKYFLEVLESGSDSTFSPENVEANSASEVRTHRAAKWLLNVGHMTLGTYPEGVPERYRVPESAFQTKTKIPKFRNIAASLGLDTFDLCGGVICDDFDNDGYLDIVTSTWDPNGQINFFRNNGDGSFEDRTQQAGLTGIFGGLNISQTDFNNDGFLDVYVTRGAWTQAAGRKPNSLLRNNGDGTFCDIAFAAGLAGPGFDYPTQVSQWADYDADGDVDLFVGNEYKAGIINAPCQLFRNNGDETFTNVAKEAGVENLRFTKGASFGDYDNDGDPDLYVSNLRQSNRLYQNNGDGTFKDVAPELGVTKPSASFPTWFFDFDNDGNLDLFVAGYTGNIDNLVGYYCGTGSDHEPSCLYKGDGNGGFTNVTQSQGLDVPMLPMGANFGDLNNDGFLDFYLGTGDPNYESLTPNMMFLNQGGSGFVDVTMGGGFGHLQKGHGIAFADLDNDGDAEVFEQMGGAFLGDRFGNILFENPGFGNNWLTLHLVGSRSNRAAVGARIEVIFSEEGKTRSVWRTVNSGGSFGANPLRQTIGIGKADQVDTVRIHWPKTDKTQSFTQVEPNQFYRIREGKRKLERITLKSIRLSEPREASAE